MLYALRQIHEIPQLPPGPAAADVGREWATVYGQFPNPNVLRSTANLLIRAPVFVPRPHETRLELDRVVPKHVGRFPNRCGNRLCQTGIPPAKRSPFLPRVAGLGGFWGIWEPISPAKTQDILITEVIP